MKRIIARNLTHGKRLCILAATIALFLFILPATTSAHITTLIPTSAAAGSPDFTLVIQGEDLDRSDRVLWNGTALTTTFDSETQVHTLIPANLIANTGSVNVTLAGFPGILIFTIIPATSCTSSVSPEKMYFHYTEQIAIFDITAPAGCPWEVTSTPTWMHVRSGYPRNGVGPGSTRFDVDENNYSFRVGVLGIAGKAVVVWQGTMADANCLLVFCIAQPLRCRSSSQPGGALAVLRAFRDGVLTRSPRGQRYTSLYYRFTTEAVGIAMVNPSLILRSREIFERYKSTIEAMLGGEKVTLSRGDIQEIETLLDAFAQKGSPEFQESVKGLSDDLYDPQVHSEFNISVIEGPKREMPAQANLECIKQPTIMIAPLGLLLFCIYSARLLRKKAEVVLNRLISGGKKMERIIAPPGSRLVEGLARGKRPCLLVVSLTIFFFISPAPTFAHINALIPSSTAAGGPDFTLTIQGVDILPTERILWNGSPLTTTWINSGELRAMIPAHLIISPGTATVTLEGSNSLIFTITPPTSCRYFIGIGNRRLIGQTFSADGGTGTVQITTEPTCAWAAEITSGDSFVSLTSAHSVGGSELLSPLIATGSGPGSVGYSVRPSSRADRRSAVIRLYRRDFAAPLDAEQFTVNQEGTRCPASAYSISPLDRTFQDYSDTGSIQVTAPRDCLWTASSEQPWITVSERTMIGTGSGTVSYEVSRNDGLWRSGTVTVAGKEFSVFQIPSDCLFRLMCAYFPHNCDGGPTGPTGPITASLRFRDEVLAKTPHGQRYIRLYYQFSKEAVAMVLLNPALILRSQEMLQRYKPVLDSMIRGERVTLTVGDIAEIEEFLGCFETKGSPELREAIRGLTEELRDPQLQAEFNITVTEGPMRESPPQGAVGRFKQTGIMMAPLGLLLFCLYRIRPRRKYAEAALKRLISMGVVLCMVSGHGAIVSGQTKNSGQRSVVSGQLKLNRERLPFTFEANQGQTDPQVKFISRRNGYNLFLTQTEAIMALRAQGVDHQPTTTDALQMKLIGANPLAHIEGLDKTPAVSNYFGGRDSATWQANVPSYTKIRYSQIYPGVDMIYYGNRRNLEYDLIVAPGADPAQIRVAFEGAQKIELDAGGDLVLHTHEGEVRQRKPVAYQEAKDARQEIPSRYVLIRNPKSEIGNPMVGFEVGPYDASRPLVIDPVMSYSTYFGGGGNEEGNSIAVDSAGSVYITGFTDSINFPLASASQPTLGGGQQDAFVVKLDPSGTRVIYSTYLGGNGQDNGTSIAVDAAGNAYITGFTDSTNFPVRNALQGTKRGDFSAFVVKLNPTGSILNSTLFGGTTSDYGSSIAVDSAGNIYAAGIATSSDLPLANALQATNGGLVDMFAAKIDPSGSRLIYSTYLGGIGIEGASSIAVDSAGNLYLTGLTSSPDFRTLNALQPVHGGGLFDAFVTKLNPSGSQIIYSTFLGGGGEDRAFRIAVDSAGNAYVTGDTDSTNFPLANAAQSSRGGSADAFVAKLNPSGNQLVYSTYIGGSGIDGGTAIAVDSAGGAYVTGFTASINFPTANALQQVFGGAYDGFIAKLSSSGSALEYSTYLGGSGVDSGFGIATDASGSAYVMGVTGSVNFPVANAFQAANGGGAADLFIAKIKSGPTITGAMIDGKTLFVFGGGFDSKAKILIDGEAQKSANDDQNPAGALVGKKAGKKIKRGETVTLQVRNSDGTLSNEFRFTRS